MRRGWWDRSILEEFEAIVQACEPMESATPGR